jgi:hypothetical protein
MNEGNPGEGLEEKLRNLRKDRGTLEIKDKPTTDGLNQIVHFFEQNYKKISMFLDKGLTECENYLNLHIQNFSYPSGDVEAFVNRELWNLNEELLSTILKNDYIPGFYTSVLINNLQNLSEFNFKPISKLSYLGHNNQGHKIVIECDVGNSVGNGMINGEIIVKGNADQGAGAWMKGGKLIIEGYVNGFVGHAMDGREIYINGNAEAPVGSFMKNGKITVKGDVEDWPGYDSYGGEIHINGDIGSIATSTTKAKIYHKGVLIHPK